MFNLLMPFLDKPKDKSYVIFSPIQGVLTHKGVPLANVKIKRELTWNANETGIVDYVYTDANGQFALTQYDAVFKMSVLTQFVASQYISAEHNGEEIEIWSCGKMREDLFAEIGHDPGPIQCELTTDFARVADNPSSLMTRCRWQNITLETDED